VLGGYLYLINIKKCCGIGFKVVGMFGLFDIISDFEIFLICFYGFLEII